MPDVGGEKAFELLRIWMMNGSKVAIASTILVSKDTADTNVAPHDSKK